MTSNETGLGLTLAGPGGQLDMPEIGVSIPLASLYDGLAFHDPEAKP